MGYKCDVCASEDGAVFCFADETVLCGGCDARVHNANKSAKQHERVRLQRETECATCDICQEHKAVMFCSEDRALICRRCDLMIHTANEFVAKHHRYLLSGVSVGLKPLEGSAANEGEEGTSRKAYGLRRNAPSSKERDSWRSGTDLKSSPAELPAAGMAGGVAEASGSQPSLINIQNLGSGPPSLEPLDGAAFPTPFGRKEEQFNDSASPSTSHQADGYDPSSSTAFGGWGVDILGSQKPNSSDFTLAAELLGMPSVSQAFTAKDIDAAYIFDDGCDLDANLSALFEVPDLDDFQVDTPKIRGRGDVGASLQGAEGSKLAERGSPSDGVVPDLHQNFKRQRI